MGALRDGGTGLEIRGVILARVAGLLKGRIQWEPDAFAPLDAFLPMTVEELAGFDGAPVFPPVDPAVKLGPGL